LGEWCDVGLVRKVYKLGDGGVGNGKGKGKVKTDGSEEVTEEGRKEMESVILGLMSIKGT